MLYDGPYRVEERPVGAAKPPRGVIWKHADKPVLLLICPACGAFGFFVGTTEGPDDAPTAREVLSCGCKMCDGRFRINAGRLAQAEPDPEPPEIPEDLQRAGVKRPPRCGQIGEKEQTE